MKSLIILMFCLICFNSYSATEVDVLSSEFGVKDYNNKPTLCLTVVRVPTSGSLLGIVESIEDCFYARKAQSKLNYRLKLPLEKMQKIFEPKMRRHLQRIDAQLEFYYSEGE